MVLDIVGTGPALIEGTDLVGEFQGSGYREPPHLVSRCDGQLVRLPPLLYAVVKALHNQAGYIWPRQLLQQFNDLIADVEHQTGIRLTRDQLGFVVDRKLAPLGLTTYCDGREPEITKPNPFLALRFKMALLPESATWFVAGLFSWLYRPLVMVFCVTATAVCEIWVFATQDPAAALNQVMRTPSSMLLVILAALLSTGFHEFGHAAACRYGGVRPGSMGCGIYLVWPVFYTDITNSYRLDRVGRLRTDLGGVYFNALFVVFLALAYAQTGSEVLLVTLLATNLEIMQQLLPTLRFDGYYIVSDLVGIPDLFKYIGPIIKRYVLRQPADSSLDLLKRWPQIIVSLWVLCVVPALIFQLGLMVFQLPTLVSTLAQSVQALVHAISAPSDVLTIISSVAQVLVMLLPVAGITLLIWLMLLKPLIRAVRNYQQRSGKHRLAQPTEQPSA